MSADVIKLDHRRFDGSEPPEEKSTRELVSRARSALRLLKVARDDLAAGDRRLRITREVGCLIDLAASEIEKGLAADIDQGRNDLAEALMHALGPDLTVGQWNSARRMLLLILGVMPEYPEGGAA